MSRAAALIAPLAVGLATWCTAGCTETVGFISLRLDLPSWSPSLSCKDDPRRTAMISVEVRCADGSVKTKRYRVDAVQASLGDVPLDSCTVAVEAENRYGRTVLSGKATVDVEAGENDPVTVTLVAEPCGKTCDGDGDHLADSDERKLGTDPTDADSDGDGLDDGLELTQCCSDPRSRASNRCKLLLQGVFPPFAEVLDLVGVRATAKLDRPTVTLGGRPLKSAVADGTTVIGAVAPGAVLGEVTLESGGAKHTFSDLFAVLQREPQPIFELDRATTQPGTRPPGGLMQDLIGIAHSGQRLFLLGRGAGTRGDAVLLVVERVAKGTPVTHRFALSVPQITPVAIAASATRLALLGYHDKTGLLVWAKLDEKPPPAPRVVTFDAMHRPVDVLIEPSEDFVQILTRGGLLRLAPGSAANGAKPLPLPWVSQGPLEPSTSGAVATSGCTGLAYLAGNRAAGSGHTYLACNTGCPAAGRCTPRAALLRIGPVGSCLRGANLRLGCAFTAFSNRPDTIVGAPVIDSRSHRVYALTSGAGLLSWPIALRPPRLLAPLVPFRWQGKGSSPELMQLHQSSGTLFVADGDQVRALKPRARRANERIGRAFSIGLLGEKAETLLLDDAGGVLEIGRGLGAGFDSLFSVCLRRCPTCLCR